LTAGLLLHKDGHEIKIIDKAQPFQKSGYGLSLKSFGIKLFQLQEPTCIVFYLMQ
jgi:2-polyprenyl-6-methoxyphenol hydroxylase-like FAD-dependent oxidoreductase